jgi:oxazoline/thiazoline dehydrogenase
VARVKETHTLEVAAPCGEKFDMEFASRPYPSGGALYELEFYVTVNHCQDLARGFYHYEPLHHRLEHLAAPAQEVEALLADAAR